MGLTSDATIKVACKVGTNLGKRGIVDTLSGKSDFIYIHTGGFGMNELTLPAPQDCNVGDVVTAVIDGANSRILKITPAPQPAPTVTAGDAVLAGEADDPELFVPSQAKVEQPEEPPKKSKRGKRKKK